LRTRFPNHCLHLLILIFEPADLLLQRGKFFSVSLAQLQLHLALCFCVQHASQITFFFYQSRINTPPNIDSGFTQSLEQAPRARSLTYLQCFGIVTSLRTPDVLSHQHVDVKFVGLLG
jgi:hypothetical protein